MIRPALVLLLALGACAAPPRTAAWWRAHPDAAATEVADCKAAGRRTPDCAAAEQALADAQRDARMATFKKAIGDGH